ncbi:MAG: class I SAM-dependent methyltransferase [Vicinamibacteria bacterium]|nr:class I SAM-dependent methyltransferase [Vicinamibacteria bacterium]
MKPFQFFSRILYRYGWDTRCRIEAVAKTLRPLLNEFTEKDANHLLDIGCGYPGVALLLPEFKVTGVDTVASRKPLRNVNFIQTSGSELPFSDRSFPVVSSVDMVEHLPLRERIRAVAEMVRVADSIVMIACPCGEVARQCDEEYCKVVRLQGGEVPSWLIEHSAQVYPTKDDLERMIATAAEAYERSVEFMATYCEPANICNFVRLAAARNKLLYIIMNLLVGMTCPLIALPDEFNGYRILMVAKLS